MNVIIISFFNHWVTHLGAELELAEKHLQAGDSVTFLVCDGSVGGCITNPMGNTHACNTCRLRRIDGIMELSGDVEVHSLKAKMSQEEAVDATSLCMNPTIEDYKALDYKGHDLGWAAISSAISVSRDPLCEGEENMQMAKKFLAAAVLSYEACRSYLGEHTGYDRAYVFNGRFAVTRGALRALQDAQIPTFTHERGCSMNHYQLFPNSLPHDLVLFQERVLTSWDEANEIEHRNEIANQFFEERKNGKPLNWTSFTDNQSKDALPSHWNVDERKIVIFNSSEDELMAIGDKFKNPVYKSQAECVERITRDTIATGKPIHYYLRVHPNLSEVKNTRLQELLDVASPNLTIIHADDDVSTYCLLDACDCVLTFGSTVGVEATYWGKPSILAGKSLYDALGVAYLPRNHAQVMNTLLDENLQPKSRLGALKYGYYARTCGIPFEHWKPTNLTSGNFGNLSLSNDAPYVTERRPFHITVFISLMSLAKSKRSLMLVDWAAKYIAIVHQYLRRLAVNMGILKGGR